MTGGKEKRCERRNSSQVRQKERTWGIFAREKKQKNEPKERKKEQMHCIAFYPVWTRVQKRRRKKSKNEDGGGGKGG